MNSEQSDLCIRSDRMEALNDFNGQLLPNYYLIIIITYYLAPIFWMEL